MYNMGDFPQNLPRYPQVQNNLLRCFLLMNLLLKKLMICWAHAEDIDSLSSNLHYAI